VVEHVLVQEVSLVEQEDRMDLLRAQLLDVARDFVEDGSRGCLR